MTITAIMPFPSLAGVRMIVRAQSTGSSRTAGAAIGARTASSASFAATTTATSRARPSKPSRSSRLDFEGRNFPSEQAL